MHTIQMEDFPITLNKANKCLMEVVELDGNYINAAPMKARTTKDLITLEEFKEAICDNRCRVELTPADTHRQNAAERAIQTFKRHCISILAGVADDFPIYQWDELIPQAILTLNLLRQLNNAPNVSACAYHHGQFVNNRMPLCPMGCAVQFHNKLSKKIMG
ncbi:hypothetical protein ACHAW6_009321 [Cyclotella cf. meneghiniana]